MLFYCNYSYFPWLSTGGEGIVNRDGGMAWRGGDEKVVNREGGVAWRGGRVRRSSTGMEAWHGLEGVS
jgi:hypothetical protein